MNPGDPVAVGAFVETANGVNPVSPFAVDDFVETVVCIAIGVVGTFIEGVVFIVTGVCGTLGDGVLLMGGVPQIHLPQVEGVVDGFVRRWGIVVDIFGVVKTADGFGVVNIVDALGVVNIVDALGVVNFAVAVMGVVLVSLKGTDPCIFVGVKAPVVPGAVAFVVPILAVVDFVSKYGRYPVGCAVVDFVNR